MTRRPTPPPGWEPRHGEAGGWVGLVRGAAARAGDQRAVDAGETWDGLMRRAAGHLARGVLDVAGRGYGIRVVVLAGKGDNGGDGWACAPLLRDAGAQVTVVAVDGVGTAASSAATAFRSRWIRSGGRVLEGVADLALTGADVVVDCLLGTGTTGAPRGTIADACRALAEARTTTHDGLLVVACDVPTGVDADTGEVAGEAVQADLTVTFGAIKRGLLLHPGAAHVGRLVVGALGDRYAAEAEGWSSLTAAGAAPVGLAGDAEKRTRGVALAVVGAAGTAGAASLCARGLLTGGAGLVTAAVPGSILSTVALAAPSAMTRALPDDGHAVVGSAVDALQDLEVFDVVVAGPGLTPGPGTRVVVDHLVEHSRRLVLDADALNVHRGDPDALAGHAGELVLTPHARELARLSGQPDAGDRRAEVARELARSLGATIVAKGPGTIVAAPDGRVWVTPVGGPALATGGTGDVLAGLVGAAIATAPDVPLAVARAVWQHAFGGQLLGALSAERLTAEALVNGLPFALTQLGQLADDRPAWPLDGAAHPPHLQERQ